MKKHRIGMVDLDSSHPASFLQALREHGGFEVTAVCDGGDVRPPGYAETFAGENGIPMVLSGPEDMPGKVDAALILGVDWDKHLARARPFLEAGVPVFIDKPVFGRLRDGYEMKRMAEVAGTPLMGGSGVRYDGAVIALRDELAPIRGQLDSAFACGPGTFYYYGIHTVETIHTVLGGGVCRVRQAGSDRDLFELVYCDGLTVWLRLECARPLHFAVFIKDKPARILGKCGGYFNILQHFAKMIETRQPPIPFSATVETTALMIAVHKARGSAGWVSLDALNMDEGPDGAAFTQWYRHN